MEEKLEKPSIKKEFGSPTENASLGRLSIFQTDNSSQQNTTTWKLQAEENNTSLK